MQFFDTHAHIGLIYDDPIEQLRVIQEAKQANVTRIVSICNSLHDFTRVYANLKSVPGIYHAVGVSPSEVIAVGDEENDRHMIEFAGLGVAMGNARDSIKEIANHITDTNDNHGVAKVIEDFILNV